MEDSFHMSPEEFRRHGHAVIDWIARYMQEVENFPVLSSLKPGEVRALQATLAQRTGEQNSVLLLDGEQILLPRF